MREKISLDKKLLRMRISLESAKLGLRVPLKWTLVARERYIRTLDLDECAVIYNFSSNNPKLKQVSVS